MAILPSISTDRLFMRPFKLEDVPSLVMQVGDRAIAETYSEIPHPFDEAMAEGWIGTHQVAFDRGDRLILAIELQTTRELIGGIGLELSDLHQSAEVGYWVGKPYWNQGYATEATKALLEYAFGTMKLHRIQARHMTKNPASARVIRKAGMTYEGTLRQSLFRFGKFEDAAIYSILRNEYFDSYANV